MTNIDPIRTQRVPVLHPATHTAFSSRGAPHPVVRTERVVRDPQTGRSVSYDDYQADPRFTVRHHQPSQRNRDGDAFERTIRPNAEHIVGGQGRTGAESRMVGTITLALIVIAAVIAAMRGFF